MSKKANNEDIRTKELESQLEYSGIFTHNALSVQADRVNEIESFLYGLIDTLIANNTIEQSALEESVKKGHSEILEKKEQFV